MNIRKAKEKDIQNIEKICIETAPPVLRKNKKAREITLQTYNKFYTRASLEHCFVATNEQDEAVGYILCAPDYESYLDSFKHTELKKIFKLNPLKGLYAYGEALVQKPYSKAFPAHLHIDILAPYHRMGIGTALMEQLKAHLKTIQCKGVFLSVGKTNAGAVAFYKAQNFEILKEAGGAYLMGCTL